MIHVRYFGQVAEQTNCASETFEVPVDGFLELKNRIIEQYQLDPSSIQFAINHRMVQTTKHISLSEDDEVAVLPPFAGG